MFFLNFRIDHMFVCLPGENSCRTAACNLDPSELGKGHTEPPMAALPAILRFVRYDFSPQPKTLPQHLLAKRRVMAGSVKQAARLSTLLAHGRCLKPVRTV
jgi:hypothetical protein